MVNGIKGAAGERGRELPPVLPHPAVLEGLAYAAFEMHYKATMQPGWLLPRAHWTRHKGARDLWSGIVATLLLAEPALSEKHAQMNATDPVTVARSKRLAELKAERDAATTPEERKRIKDRQFGEIYGITGPAIKLGDHLAGVGDEYLAEEKRFVGKSPLLAADYGNVETRVLVIDDADRIPRASIPELKTALNFPSGLSTFGFLDHNSFMGVEPENRKARRSKRARRRVKHKT